MCLDDCIEREKEKVFLDYDVQIPSFDFSSCTLFTYIPKVIILLSLHRTIFEHEVTPGHLYLRTNILTCRRWKKMKKKVSCPSFFFFTTFFPDIHSKTHFVNEKPAGANKAEMGWMNINFPWRLLISFLHYSQDNFLWKSTIKVLSLKVPLPLVLMCWIFSKVEIFTGHFFIPQDIFDLKHIHN